MTETIEHTEQRRPRGRWSGTCPLCPGKLAEGPKHSLVCLGCETTITPPPRAPASWEVTGEQWEDYSAPGGLVAEWGRSTVREAWSPPRDKASAEDPHIREPHTRGRQDDLLDAAVGAYVAGTERLTDTLRTLVKRARTAPKASQKPTKKKGAAEEIADLLFAHLDEATHAPADPLRQVVAGLTPPAHAGPLVGATALGVAVHMGLFSGAIALAADILLRRGVDLWAALGLGTGPLEPLAFRLPRTERFAGSHHAVAVALSEPEIAPRPSPPAAPGKHPIPGGIQFGRIALNPSHTGSGRAPGESAVIDMLDAQRALGGLTQDDLALLADDKPDPNKRKQRERAWEKATDALRERQLIPPRKRRPVRAAPPPAQERGASRSSTITEPVAPLVYQPAVGLLG